MLQSEKIAGLQLKIHNMCQKNSGTSQSKRLEPEPLARIKQ